MAHMKAEEFPGDGGDDDIRVLTAGGEPAEAFAQADLSLPADGLHGRGEALDALLNVRGDLGRKAVGPGAFDQESISN